MNARNGSPMTRMTHGLAAALLALCLTNGLSGCLTELAGGSSSTETGDKVSLNGRVTGGTGDGVSGVIVSLTGTTLADTTDVTGAWSLEGQRERRAHGAETDADPMEDTLRFTLAGQTVAVRALTTLTGTVPEVRIVQRGFSGTFSGNSSLVARVEGVVKGDGIAEGDSVAATFFHNTLANNYSGFIWFPPPGDTVRMYSIVVHAYDAAGTRTGSSLTVGFNSNAGNVTIPAFNPTNLVPATDTTATP